MSNVTFSYGGKEVELKIDGTCVTKTFRNNDEPRIPGAITQLDFQVDAYLERLARESGIAIIEAFQTTDLTLFGLGSGLGPWIRTRAAAQGYEITYDDGCNVRAQRIHPRLNT